MLLSPKASRLQGALAVYLGGRIAEDQALPSTRKMVEGVTARNWGQMRPRIAARVRQAMRGRIAQDANIEDLIALLDHFDESEEGVDAGATTEEGVEDLPWHEEMGVAPPPEEGGEETDDAMDARHSAEDKRREAEDKRREAEDRRRAAEDKRREADDKKRGHDRRREADDELGSHEDGGLPEPIEHVLMDEAMDWRAEDARRHLGRDETPEECAEREERQGAEDARHRLGRDESEEEAEDRRREADDSRKRRSARDARRAEDARHKLGRDESMEEAEDRRKRHRAADRKRAEDARRKHADDARYGRDNPPPFPGMPEPGGGMSQDSMKRMIADGVRQAQDAMNAKYEAERFVQPWVGQLTPETMVACDSAKAVYSKALSILGVQADKSWPVDALRTMIQRSPRPSAAPQPVFSIAADSAPNKQSIRDRIPGLSRIRLG